MVGVVPWHWGTTTEYGQDWLREFPARSAAVSTAESVPAAAVETSLLMVTDGGPESESVTTALTVAIDWPSSKVGAAPQVMVGGVASRLTVTDPDPWPPAEVAVQAYAVPAESTERVDGSQPVRAVIGDSLSVTAQLTETFERYQPLLPSVPFTVGVTTGAV